MTNDNNSPILSGPDKGRHVFLDLDQYHVEDVAIQNELINPYYGLRRISTKFDHSLNKNIEDVV